jgi:hypothetical protein
MIADDQELKVTLARIAKFQDQLAPLRNVESNPVNYHRSASGFIAEMDRMQLEVREYLSAHPTELAPQRLHFVRGRLNNSDPALMVHVRKSGAKY